MIEINLIPDVKQELIKAQRTRGIVISSSILASIIAAAIVVLLLVYVFGIQTVRSAYLDGQIDTKGQEYTQVEDLAKTLTIQNQLAALPGLNDQKLITSRMFDVIASVTPPNDASIAFSQINLAPGGLASGLGMDGAIAEGGGQIQLEGQTASYDTMELFKKRIENTSFQYTDENGEDILVPLASNISTSDISYGENANGAKVLRFTLTFDYPPELFSSSTADQQLAFKLTADGNVTDSYTGIPRFSERASDLDEGEE